MKKSKQSASSLPHKKRKINHQTHVSEANELEPNQPSVVTGKSIGSTGYACEDQFAVVTKIRQQVNHWLKKDAISPELKILKENSHFTIHVEPVGENKLSLCINCGYCGKDYTLGFKDDKIYLSNWTRHVPVCMKKHKNAPVYKCKPIDNFFVIKGQSSQKSIINSKNHCIVR